MYLFLNSRVDFKLSQNAIEKGKDTISSVIWSLSDADMLATDCCNSFPRIRFPTLWFQEMKYKS